MEWDDATIQRLRDLWAEGLSTAKIGVRMNISKNAVVGKAHRLDLPPRPSPIKRDGHTPPRPVAPKRVTGPTLPPLGTPLVFAERATPAPRPKPRKPALPSKPISVRTYPVSACCWPIGNPGDRGFRFCDSQAIGGRVYCVEHTQIAYVRTRDRDEAAA